MASGEQTLKFTMAESGECLPLYALPLEPAGASAC